MNFFVMKYNFKSTIRNKSAMFWSLIFPFVLATVFKLTFGGFDNVKEGFKNIPVAIENDIYLNVFNQINAGETKLFDIKEFDDMNKALEENEIIGYITTVGGEAEVVIKKNTLETVLFYNIANYINHNYAAVLEIVKSPEAAVRMEEIIKDLSESGKVNIESGADLSGKSKMAIYFYGLMAMICMGASSFGVNVVENSSLKSDVKHTRRLAVSPVKRSRMLVADFMSNTIITMVNTIILYIYIRYLLKVDFGGTGVQIIIGLILGNIMSILMGMCIALLVKGSADYKMTISAAVYVGSSALTGMMGAGVAGFVENHARIINYINPGSVLTKMFTSLYMYNNNAAYIGYLLNLLAIMAVFAVFSALLARRRRNDCI